MNWTVILRALEDYKYRVNTELEDPNEVLRLAVDQHYGRYNPFGNVDFLESEYIDLEGYGQVISEDGKVLEEYSDVDRGAGYRCTSYLNRQDLIEAVETCVESYKSAVEEGPDAGLLARVPFMETILAVLRGPDKIEVFDRVET